MPTTISVPFPEKDQAKSLGAIWNQLARTWQVPDGCDIRLFSKWADKPKAQPKPEFPSTGRPKPTLYVDLVPETAWFSNLRSILTEAEWGECKRMSYRRAVHRCEACGGKGREWPVEAHERWAYCEETHVQRLVDIVALCPACHEASHLGLANSRGHGEKAIAHLMRVNGWSQARADSHIKNAFIAHRRHSEMDWRLDATWVLDKGVPLSQETRQSIRDMADGIAPRM